LDQDPTVVRAGRLEVLPLGAGGESCDGRWRRSSLKLRDNTFSAQFSGMRKQEGGKGAPAMRLTTTRSSSGAWLAKRGGGTAAWRCPELEGGG
jgi:hypothetical protein